jgi:FKBP-type peptidyl-prolyl cis-trans isomerase
VARAGWDKGCLTMRLGERAKLTIRGDKGYGPAGFPAWGIKPNATLFFEITILSIN